MKNVDRFIEFAQSTIVITKPKITFDAEAAVADYSRYPISTKFEDLTLPEFFQAFFSLMVWCVPTDSLYIEVCGRRFSIRDGMPGDLLIHDDTSDRDALYFYEDCEYEVLVKEYGTMKVC